MGSSTSSGSVSRFVLRRCIAFDPHDDGVWVSNDVAGSVSRIDPATNAVVDTVTVGPHPFVVRTAFGDIWAGEFQGNRIWRIHVPS